MRGLDPRAVIGLLETFVLDNGKPWPVEPFQAAIVEELCAGAAEVWWETPEGNAKSTSAGGIALALILLKRRARVRITSTAKAQVADAIYGQAAAIVEDTPGLANVLDVRRGSMEIRCPDQRSDLAGWSASDSTGEGIIPDLAMGDELHKLRELALLDTWRGKLRKKDGQLLGMSNAGAPNSPYETAKEEHLARCHTERRAPGWEVSRGRRFVMHRHAVLDESADVLDADVVKAANPLSTITRESIQEDLDSVTFKLSRHRRMRCGIPTRDLDVAISEELWSRVPFGDIPTSAIVDLSIDPARMWDCFAITPIWFASRTERYIGEPEILEAPRNGVDVIPTSVLKRAVLRAGGRFAGVRQVTVDLKREGAVIAEWITSSENDAPGWPVVDISAGDVVQSMVHDRFMESITEGWLHRPRRCWVSGPSDQWQPQHRSSATFDQHVGNAVAKPIGRDRRRFDRPSQSRSATLQDRRVIDALVAASNGLWQRLGDLDADPVLHLDESHFHITRL